MMFQNATLCKQISALRGQMRSKSMWSDNPLNTAHVDVTSSTLFHIKLLRSYDQHAFTPFVIFLTEYNDLTLYFFYAITVCVRKTLDKELVLQKRRIGRSEELLCWKKPYVCELCLVG